MQKRNKANQTQQQQTLNKKEHRKKETKNNLASQQRCATIKSTCDKHKIKPTKGRRRKQNNTQNREVRKHEKQSDSIRLK